MKQIDKLLLKSFIGPFLVAFGVALFVLIMQFLWLYIDEIAGKGISIFILLELIGYMSISTFPMALPIAVLIASVMVMGNMAERYELSTLRSAGVSLTRIMFPLMVVSAAIAGFSFFCSNFLILKSNLQSRARLIDIRKQKPALSIEKSTFNEDFRQFIIRVGEKERDGETIGDVIIEDQTNNARVKFNQILADSGQMFTTADKRYFVMNLFNGAQYQEPGSNGSQQKQKYPFIRTKFKSWSKVWDMQEFEMNRTDEDLLKNQRSVLSMQQLQANIDSFSRMIIASRKEMANDILTNVKRKPLQHTSLPFPPGTPIQQLDKPLKSYPDFISLFPKEHHQKMRDNALKQIQLYETTIENRKTQIDNRRLENAKTGYELYTKHSFALVCIIFLFIGSPMGAIIRKGGFGYSILVSILFFVTFIFLTTMCRKLAESFVLPPFGAAMMPCIVMALIGLFLTVKATNDEAVFGTNT